MVTGIQHYSDSEKIPEIGPDSIRRKLPWKNWLKGDTVVDQYQVFEKLTHAGII
jgi:hypothetical protein